MLMILLYNDKIDVHNIFFWTLMLKALINSTNTKKWQQLQMLIYP